MKKSVLFFGTLCCTFFLMAQKKIVPKVTSIVYKLGEDQTNIKIFQYGKKNDIVFINLHADETTSVAGAEKLLETKGGILIKLENNNKRNISFDLNNQTYTFDPNRIFSQTGVKRTLSNFKNISDTAIQEIEKFATQILSLLPVKPECIIALHNNTEGNLSVNSYLPGNKYETDAKRVYADRRQDPDDFFLTTDSLLFRQLVAEKYNAVLQDNLLVLQDGSLSVYFGEKNICYLNCETEHGKVKQYEEMVTVVLQCIEQRKNGKDSAIR